MSRDELAYAYGTDAFQPTEWLMVRCRIFYSRMAVDRLGGFSFLTDDGPVSFAHFKYHINLAFTFQLSSIGMHVRNGTRRFLHRLY